MESVFFESRTSWADCRWTRLRGSKVRNSLPAAAARWVFRRFRLLKVWLRTRSAGVKLETIGNVNDRIITSRLESDLILLGGIGLVGDEVLSKARLGVLNGHPGLLPWLRGTGVVGGALDKMIPVGASCHFVDTGVDTGPTVARRILQIDRSIHTLSDLELRADELASKLLIDVVEEWVTSGKRPVSLNFTNRVERCRWPDADGRSRQDASVANGQALRLFRDCVRAGCCDSEGNVSVDYEPLSYDA